MFSLKGANGLIAGRAVVRFAEVSLNVLIPLAVIINSHNIWGSLAIMFITYSPAIFLGFVFPYIDSRLRLDRGIILYCLIQVISVGTMIWAVRTSNQISIDALLFICNSAATFLNMSCKAATRILVPVHEIRRVNSKIKSAVAMSRIIAPTIIGLLLVFTSLSLTVSIVFGEMVLSTMIFLNVARECKVSLPKSNHFATIDTETFRVRKWFRTHPVAREILSLNMVLNLGVGLVIGSFMFFLVHVMHSSSPDVALLYSIPGIASLVVSILMRKFEAFIGPRWNTVCIQFYLLCTISIGLLGVSSIWIVGIAYFLYQSSLTLVDIESLSRLQSMSDKNNISSIIGFYSGMVNLAIPIGFALGGFLTEAESIVFVYIFMGCGLTLYGLVRLRVWLKIALPSNSREGIGI